MSRIPSRREVRDCQHSSYEVNGLSTHAFNRTVLSTFLGNACNQAGGILLNNWDVNRAVIT